MSLTAAPKIIFFDVDETLYSNHSPRGPHVPESTRQALHELHQKGIRTAVALRVVLEIFKRSTCLLGKLCRGGFERVRHIRLVAFHHFAHGRK